MTSDQHIAAGESEHPEGTAVAPAATRGRTPFLAILPLVLAVVAVGLAVKLFTDSQASAAGVALPGAVTSPYRFTSGTPAPEFMLQALDGRPVSLRDYRGKTVVVNFWATWCPPCRSEMPDLEQIYAERKDELVVLAVNLQEAREPVQRFVDQYGLTFPIVMDTSGNVSQSFGVQSLPTTFFVDKEGRVAAFNMGPLNKSAIAKKLELVPQ